MSPRSNSIAEQTRDGHDTVGLDYETALTIEIVQIILVVIDNDCIAVRRRAVPGLGHGMCAGVSFEGMRIRGCDNEEWVERMLLSFAGRTAMRLAGCSRSRGMRVPHKI